MCHIEERISRAIDGNIFYAEDSELQILFFASERTSRISWFFYVQVSQWKRNLIFSLVFQLKGQTKSETPIFEKAANQAIANSEDPILQNLDQKNC